MVRSPVLQLRGLAAAAPFALALSLAVSPLTAQPLTLEQAIETAVEHNLWLAASDARLGAATAEADVARAGRLPRVRLEANVQETDNPTLVFSHKLAQGAFEEADFAVDALNQPSSLTNWQSRLSVEQPLWTGGRLKHGIAAAVAGVGAAEAQREAARQQVVYATIDAWTGAVVARSRVELARSTVTTAEANLGIVGDLHEAGLVVASDPLQAEVRLAEVQEMLAQAEADAATAVAALRMVLGGWDGELSLPPALPGTVPAARDESPEAPESPETLESMLDQAASARPALAAARLSGQAAEELSRLERASRLPEVGLHGFAEADHEDFFGGGSGGTNYALTVGLSLDLFDPSRRARVARAEARRNEADAQVEALSRQVELDVTRSFHQLGAVAQRVELTRRAIVLAEESLRIVRDRYQNGLAVITELLDSETSLTAAKLRGLAAERDLRLARAGLDLAVGRL